MLPVGFEPTFSAGEQSKIYALDRTVTGPGGCIYTYIYINLYAQHNLSRVFEHPSTPLWESMQAARLQTKCTRVIKQHFAYY
jgi:hypothetical protein